MRVHRVVIGFVAGLIIGSAIGASNSPVALRVVGLIEPVGELWVNAIRMTVLPLVVSMLFVAVADRGDGDRLAPVATATFAAYAGLLIFAAALALLIGPPLIADMHLSADASAALRASALASSDDTSARVSHLPGLGAWATSVVPVNAMKAAADSAMLPLIAFTLLFALAARRIEASLRRSLVDVFGAIAGATRGIVGWVLAAAPLGVFAIVLGTASRAGGALAADMTYYVLACSTAVVLFAFLLYPVAWFVGGIALPQFTRAVLPAQTIAVSSSSSLASLPPLIEGAESLGLPAAISGFVLPLSASVFRAATPIAWVVGTLFLAKLYGVPLGATAIATVAMMPVLLSFTIPGVPQGSLLVLATVIPAFGVPVAGVALLIAADAIPDVFATMANVTADLVVATIAARRGSPPVDLDIADAASMVASSRDA
jgi:Na+/H+-dicarboxylate symporter